ncbi:MAG: hypothetical protein U0797_27905 [Gemmataceae bacterium]
MAADGSIVAAGYAYYKDASNTAHYGYQIVYWPSDGRWTPASVDNGYVTVFDVGTVSLLGYLLTAIGPDGKILFAAVNGNPNYAVYLVAHPRGSWPVG